MSSLSKVWYIALYHSIFSLFVSTTTTLFLRLDFNINQVKIVDNLLTWVFKDSTYFYLSSGFSLTHSKTRKWTSQYLSPKKGTHVGKSFLYFTRKPNHLYYDGTMYLIFVVDHFKVAVVPLKNDGVIYVLPSKNHCSICLLLCKVLHQNCHSLMMSSGVIWSQSM